MPSFFEPGQYETCVQATDAALAELKPPEKMRGMVAIIRRLADAIDQIDDEGLNPAGKLDNVSIPTYLKYAEALGMFEAPAKAAAGKQVPVPSAAGTGGLRGILGGKAG